MMAIGGVGVNMPLNGSFLYNANVTKMMINNLQKLKI